MTNSLKIKVYLRIRSTRIDDLNFINHDDKEIIIKSPNDLNAGALKYSFDKIFQYQNQRQIYQGVLKPYINNMLEGYNLTLFTYGQTSTGKTYTLGTSTEHQEIQKYGLIQNFIIDLLPKLKEYSIKIQFLEVYNEKVKDLLYNFNSQDNVEEEILIRQDKNGNIIWYNAKEFQCHNLEEILDCLKFGIENRATGSTNKNHISSRSHAIFSLQLFNTTTKVCSKLNFVDLAGSERITKTGAVDLQLKEGIFINSGLLALGNVINALSVKSKNKKNHIPYRDSKLTRLLQDSLGEKNMMIMVACINNNRLDYHETLNTLNYATRAKKIQLNPHKNKIDDAYQDKQLIAQLKDEIVRLKETINANEVKNTAPVEKEASIIKRDESSTYLIKRIKCLEQELSHSKQKLILLQRDYGQLITYQNQNSNQYLLEEIEKYKKLDQQQKERIKRLEYQLKDRDSTYHSLNNSMEEMELVNFTNINISRSEIKKVLNLNQTLSYKLTPKSGKAMLDLELKSNFLTQNSSSTNSSPESNPQKSPVITYNENLLRYQHYTQLLQEQSTKNEIYSPSFYRKNGSSNSSLKLKEIDTLKVPAGSLDRYLFNKKEKYAANLLFQAFKI